MTFFSAYDLYVILSS